MSFDLGVGEGADVVEVTSLDFFTRDDDLPELVRIFDFKPMPSGCILILILDHGFVVHIEVLLVEVLLVVSGLLFLLLTLFDLVDWNRGGGLLVCHLTGKASLAASPGSLELRLLLTLREATVDCKGTRT